MPPRNRPSSSGLAGRGGQIYPGREGSTGAFAAGNKRCGGMDKNVQAVGWKCPGYGPGAGVEPGECGGADMPCLRISSQKARRFFFAARAARVMLPWCARSRSWM